MRVYDLIMKKRNGGALDDAEIAYLVDGYARGAIPDGQMAAMLMAIWFSGMDARETATLTMAMARSGECVDLSPLGEATVDKHSTGGVGDKTTLVAGPIVAACGGIVAKMSGRALGHTGGTVDKLETIPGYRTALSREEFFSVVQSCGIGLIGQSGNLAPADKKLYALRDATATVDSLPLIASSIMSKKLAAGSRCILLDVKVGSGAFMKTMEDAEALAEQMIGIGESAGRRMAALITNMDFPLGRAIGNSLEVIEAVDVLRGKGPADLEEVSLQIAANMLCLVGKGDLAVCREMAEAAIADGSAFETLCRMAKAQGGDDAVLRSPEKFSRAPIRHAVLADREGYITRMDAEACGMAAAMLGAGRGASGTKSDAMDFSAGIRMKKRYGEHVEKGGELAVLYTSHGEVLEEAECRYKAAARIEDAKPPAPTLLYARMDKDGITRFAEGEP